jgi:hypothetical protein
MLDLPPAIVESVIVAPIVAVAHSMFAFTFLRDAAPLDAKSA